MDRSSKTTLLLIALAIILLGSYTYWVLQKQSAARESSTDAATSLMTKDGQSDYTDIDGNPISLDDYLGQVLVVNSWASWCPFCAQELPNLARLGNEYADQEVQVLAINRAEPKSTAAAFLRSLEITDGVQLILDPDDRFYSSIAGFTMPETIFYDQAGNLILHKRGQMSYPQMQQQLETILSAADQ